MDNQSAPFFIRKAEEYSNPSACVAIILSKQILPFPVDNGSDPPFPLSLHNLPSSPVNSKKGVSESVFFFPFYFLVFDTPENLVVNIFEIFLKQNVSACHSTI